MQGKINSQISCRRTAETAEKSAVCRGWSTGTDEADQKGNGMKEKIIGIIQDAAAAISIILFLVALYILMVAG